MPKKEQEPNTSVLLWSGKYLMNPRADYKRARKLANAYEGDVDGRVFGLFFLMLLGVIVSVSLFINAALTKGLGDSLICIGIGLLLLPISLWLFRGGKKLADDNQNSSELLIRVHKSDITDSLRTFIQACDALTGAPREYLLRDFKMYHIECFSAALSLSGFIEAQKFAKSDEALMRYKDSTKKLDLRIKEIKNIALVAQDIAFKVKMAAAENGQLSSSFLEHLNIQTLSLSESIAVLDN